MKYLTDYETKAAYDAVKKDLPKPQVALTRDDYKVHFKPNKVSHDYSQDYLTVVAKGDGTISFYYGYSYNGEHTSLSYSVNEGNWVTTQEEGAQIDINVSSGDKIRWKGINKAISVNDDGYAYSYFSSNCEFDVEGNAMSLLYGDDFIDKTSFQDTSLALGGIFNNCNNLINAKNLILPATTLAELCYESMFSNCTSLTEAPQLPATTLANQCYSYMFANCTSLTAAPELPATALTYSCYYGMFNGCTLLTEAPQLPATTLAEGCYSYMFGNCTSLTAALELPATTLARSCYSQMFSNCTSLTTAPELLATTLAQNCCADMFRGCTSLTTAPELPATRLADGCYFCMFYGCSQLNYIKCLATDISASQCTSGWVTNVAATGTFVRAASMSSWTDGASGIPSGWEVEPPLTSR